MRLALASALLILCSCEFPELNRFKNSTVYTNSISVPDAPVKSPRYFSRRVLIIGDSEACSVRPYVKNVVRDINNSTKHPLDVLDVDCKGGTVVQYWGAAGNLRRALMGRKKPDVVVVFLGTNHYWQKTTPPVESILDVLIEQRIGCVWVGNTAVDGRSWPINQLMKNAIASKCVYFDTEAAQIPLWDGVHPDRKSAEKWIKEIWPVIPSKFDEY